MDSSSENIFIEPTLDSTTMSHLRSTASWSRFIGWVYAVFALIVALICVLVVFNLDSLLQYFHVMLGQNELALRFIEDYGKTIFIVFSLMAVLVLLFYAFTYLGFGKNLTALDNSLNEEYIEKSMNRFNLILIFGIITGALSLLITFLATLSLLFKS